MGSWCADKLRDCQAWREEGLQMSTTSNESAKFYDATLRQIISWINCEELGGISKTAQKMLAADPEFIMGRVLTLGLDALGTARPARIDAQYKDELELLMNDAKISGNMREQAHVRAINNFTSGHMRSACVEWEKILAEHPNDLLAIKFAHDGYFFLGDFPSKRDSVARVINKWKPSAPCYSYLHGMYAFGLEECGEYDSGESHARKALELNRQDCWATHALAHCMEMKGKYEEGIRFMESTVDDWSPCFMLACHNFWHTALFYIEKGDYEGALAIYDREVGRRCKSGSMLDVVDAASLLLRFQFEGINVGENRWRQLLPLVERHIDDHILTFNDAHIAMILSHTDREEMAKHRDSLRSFIKTGELCGDSHQVMRDIGEHICDAIVDFSRGDYEDCFSKLYRIRHVIYQIGGSHAQRDVFTQLLINAGINSRNVLHKQQVLDVIEERYATKPNSPVADRLLTKHKSMTAKL